MVAGGILMVFILFCCCSCISFEVMHKRYYWNITCLIPFRSGSSVQKAYKNVQSSLPLSIQNPRTSVMCDYLPYLRSITKNEQIRQAAKLKRRSVNVSPSLSLSVFLSHVAICLYLNDLYMHLNTNKCRKKAQLRPILTLMSLFSVFVGSTITLIRSDSPSRTRH